MSLRCILPAVIVAALAAPTWSQVSSSLPPQAVGTLPGDKEPPTELQQVQQLINSGRLPQALARTEEQLARNPRDAQMRFVRGVILTELKEREQAREVFRQLTEDFPELPEPYNNLAVIYASEGRLDNARAALEQALAAAPNYATAYENLGDIYLQMASDAYQRAAKLDPANRQATAKLNLSRELITKARSVR
jgi:Flp pilus assembly protein TadD